MTVDEVFGTHTPSGVFCYNDRMAMGLYDALREGGVKIPDDMAVVGFDNQEIIASHLRLSLSTVALPHHHIWLPERQVVLAQSQKPTEHTKSTRVTCPPVIRHSTAIANLAGTSRKFLPGRRSPH
jgi:LacI family transcriptional regulator